MQKPMRHVVRLSTAIALTATPAVAQRVADASLPPVTVLGYGNRTDRTAAAELVTEASVRAPIELPLRGLTGPQILRVQILLDAARFGPGVLDARWSENTLFALRGFREAADLPVTDDVDDAVLRRLDAATGHRDPLTRYTLTAADVRGPYRALPRSVYAQAKLPCMCYQSVVEQLGERFHTTAEVLARLNPDVDFAGAGAGTTIVVPNVSRVSAPAPARLEIDRKEGSVRGYGRSGRLLFWLPSTVGSKDEPSPRGELRVQTIQPNPRYHYDPRVLGDVPDWKPDATLAPGPNSPVGVVWVQLSRNHVGIHGTADPELVGYAQSHGCVRLTNWDVRWLSSQLRSGLPVQFR
jgi:lipoprotein-anchoring transpeptidase ErfK/SrfK